MAGISIRSCLQSLLKVVNSFIGFIGIAMILYGLWMIRVWQRGIDGSSFHSAPWFIYIFIGIGVTLCVITCLGHTAADSANSLCLSSYMVIIVLLLLTETAVTADMLLNSDWEKDLPEDPTGWFHVFKDFVESNFDMSKWIGFIIVSAQGFSILLAMILRALGPDQSSCHDNDQDHVPMMLPLLNHPVQPSHTVGKPPQLIFKNDA